MLVFVLPLRLFRVKEAFCLCPSLTSQCVMPDAIVALFFILWTVFHPCAPHPLVGPREERDAFHPFLGRRFPAPSRQLKELEASDLL